MTSALKNKSNQNKGVWRISQKSRSRHRIANLPKHELKILRNEDDEACLGDEIYWIEPHNVSDLSQDFQAVENNESTQKSVYSIWEESFVQLHQVLDTAELNPELEPVSTYAFIISLQVLGLAFQINPNLPAPDVVLSGDGGVDIEWSIANKMISIHIRKTEQGQDRIYSQNNEDFGSVEFSEENLKRALSQLL